MSRKVIIDTDPGQDDVMALMLAFGSDDLDVLAITTVAGNSTIENTTRNARYLLSYLNVDIPIFSGAAKPLTRELEPATVHGESGLEGVDPDNAADLTGDAVSQLLQIIRSSPNEVTIIALGPLTNIAAAIQQEPETMALVERIVIMGGAIAVPGNKNAVAEFNICVDPEAADIVFRTSMPKLLVPLDACDAMFVNEEEFSGIKSSRVSDLLRKMLSAYLAAMEKSVGVRAAGMWDPLTVYALLHPEHCEIASYNIAVETASELTRGMTVADRRPKTTATPNADVVMNIDRAAFVETFTELLSKL